MFFIHNRLYLLSYLNELKNSSKWKLWKKLISENNIGNPVRYFLYPKSSNKIFQTYHLKNTRNYNMNLKILNMNESEVVMEYAATFKN